MMVLVLVLFGLLLELALGAYVLLLTQKERRMLRELVERSGTDFSSAVDALPEPHRTIGRRLSDQIAMEGDFDEAILDAIVDVARQPFKKPLWMRLLVGAVCSLGCLAPASYGLMATASNVVAAWNQAQLLDKSLVYLRGQTELDTPFLLLRDAFQGSALLFFGLAFLWALAWYLRRPEVREARFVRALLESAARSSPKSAAPVSGRLSELIAPDRGLSRPVTALVFCLVGITAGWLVLYRTADVRAANDREPVFSVWPAKRWKPIEVAAELRLPASRGGSPIGPSPPPSLIIGEEKVMLGGDQLVDLPGGRLPEKWEDVSREDVRKKLAQANGRVVLLAHREIELGGVLDLMRFLFQKHGIQRFELITERTLQTGEPGGRTLQAAISLKIDSQQEVGLHLALEETRLRFSSDGPSYSYENSPWQQELRKVVRERQELLRNEGRKVVKLDVVSRKLGYRRFVEVLGAADTACMGTVDCGLPGLGLEFTISPTAPSP
jgi:hypothetical protein